MRVSPCHVHPLTHLVITTYIGNTDDGSVVQLLFLDDLLSVPYTIVWLTPFIRTST